jgi:hypothetical protein
MPHAVQSHVADPFAGTAHAVHDEVPQLAVLQLLTHVPPQL